MKRQNEIVLTLFSDPMMGLAYECEPTLDRLVERYGNRIVLEHAMVVLEHAMVVLVRDVSDFMTAEECSLAPHEGLARYNERLAFEAVRLVAPRRAEAFLRAVRRA